MKMGVPGKARAVVATIIVTVAVFASSTEAGERELFADDFSGDLDQWDLSNIEPDRSGERLLFFSSEGEWLLLKVPIPMEDVAIEFDGYTERNGFTVAWIDPEERANSATIGGWFNRKSVLKAGNIENAVYKEGTVWRPRTWHRYRVVRDGSTFIVYCDDKMVISRIEPPRLEGEGILRFSSWDSRLGIDNVRILALDGPSPEPDPPDKIAEQEAGEVEPASGGPVESMVVHLQPAGKTEPVPTKTIPGSARKIHVTFAYSALNAGDLLFARLHDAGRGQVMREMPLILDTDDGSHTFSLARGMTPWLPGRYRVDLVRGDQVLATTTFVIIEEGGP